MKIIRLQAENVKRLQAVEIKPNGNLVVIGGKNGQGKSSVLDAIECALGGKDHAPEIPIRRGENEASVVLEIGDLIIKRTFTESGNSYLKVENKEGAQFKSPQAMLDKLIGSLSFDPLEFSRMDSKKQIATLKELVGLDFTELDKKRSESFNERTVLNRQIKETESILSSIPKHDSIPENEISIQSLFQELEEIEKSNKENEKLRLELNQKRESLKEKMNMFDGIERQIEKLIEEKCKIGKEINSAIEEGKAFASKVEALVDKDSTEIREKIKSVDVINTKIRENKERSNLEKKLEKISYDAETLSLEISEIDAQKSHQLAEAKFPIQGMSFDENGVFLNGIPFSQASSAEQLRISVAMGLALNPKLRVLLVRDGSLLDENSLEMIAKMASEADAQVWIERVSEGKEVSLIIEDGMIKNFN